jgi:hypothetical protein
MSPEDRVVRRLNVPEYVAYIYGWTCPTCGRTGRGETRRSARNGLKKHWRTCPEQPAML